MTFIQAYFLRPSTHTDAQSFFRGTFLDTIKNRVYSSNTHAFSLGAMGWIDLTPYLRFRFAGNVMGRQFLTIHQNVDSCNSMYLGSSVVVSSMRVLERLLCCCCGGFAHLIYNSHVVELGGLLVSLGYSKAIPSLQRGKQLQLGGQHTQGVGDR